MQLLDLRGRAHRVVASKYLINWDKAPSQFQQRVQDFLRPYWSVSKLVLAEVPVPGSRMKVDIINVSDHIAIEVSGRQHTEYNRFMHDGSLANYRSQIKRDLSKADWCAANSLTLIEILTTDMPLSIKWFWEKHRVVL